MKKILIALVLMIPVLSGCLIIGLVDPSFSVVKASSKTNYILTQNGQQSFAICNDLITILDYEFTFSGTLITWESYVRGDQGGIAGRTQFVPGDGKSTIDNSAKTVKVKYEINPGGAPRLVAPQANIPNITVNPKALIVGYSTLFLNAEGFTQGEPLSSDKMAVIDNCSDFIP